MSSPSEPFSQARSLVWEKLSDKEKKTFSGILTIQDVWKATTDIQAQQAKNRTLGNMNKIRPYLEGLQRYSEVIGIFVQAKPEILSFIWVSSYFCMGKNLMRLMSRSRVRSDLSCKFVILVDS
jgi:hypothetical protein